MTSRYIETCTNRRDNVTRQELVPVTRQVETEGSGPFHKRWVIYERSKLSYNISKNIVSILIFDKWRDRNNLSSRLLFCRLPEVSDLWDRCSFLLLWGLRSQNGKNRLSTVEGGRDSGSEEDSWTHGPYYSPWSLLFPFPILLPVLLFLQEQEFLLLNTLCLLNFPIYTFYDILGCPSCFWVGLPEEKDVLGLFFFFWSLSHGFTFLDDSIVTGQ